MHEILRGLGRESRILDLGARTGSFDPSALPSRTFRLDLDPPAAAPGVARVRADAARLPFPQDSFDAVIANNSLEHFAEPAAALREAARVLKSGGALFVSVPDATTITDKLYRFLGRGGGHVNHFRSAEQVADLIVRETGLPHRGTRTLFSSLAFIHPDNRGHCGRLIILLGAREGAIRWFTWFCRVSDRILGTRLAVYGWALYFGEIPAPLDLEPWSNVCIRCGAARPFTVLSASGDFRQGPFVSRYRCPDCGTWNLCTRDEPFRGVR